MPRAELGKISQATCSNSPAGDSGFYVWGRAAGSLPRVQKLGG